MFYYHISLNNQSSNLFNIIIPWLKYKYKRLPIGICKSLDLFQEKMNKMFRELEFFRAYIDDLLIITRVDSFNHLNKLEQVLKK